MKQVVGTLSMFAIIVALGGCQSQPAEFVGAWKSETLQHPELTFSGPGFLTLTIYGNGRFNALYTAERYETKVGYSGEWKRDSAGGIVFTRADTHGPRLRGAEYTADGNLVVKGTDLNVKLHRVGAPK